MCILEFVNIVFVYRHSFQPSFGGGNGTVWLDNLECSGDEATLLECNHKGLGKGNCKHIEDVAVTCTPPGIKTFTDILLFVSLKWLSVEVHNDI